MFLVPNRKISIKGYTSKYNIHVFKNNLIHNTQSGHKTLLKYNLLIKKSFR